MPVLGPGGAGRNTGGTLRISGVRQGFASTARSLLIEPEVETAPTSAFVIVDSANTTVTHLGGGEYLIEKTSGVDARNAAAVSTVGTSGDFVLRLQKGSIDGFSYGGGVNNDPTTDTTVEGVDFLWSFVPPSDWYYQLNGSVNYVGTDNGYAWVWRTGTSLGMGLGTTLAAAQSSPSYTTTNSDTLYFDSHFYNVGAQFKALFYVPDAPSNDITGTSSLTFSASGTLTGTGAISGSSSLTFAPTATLTGRGAISGSSSLTFSPTGTVVGRGAITGSSSLTFAPSGTLTGKGALSGSSSLTFAPTGALTGRGALSGSSSIMFAPAASLSGVGAISGTSGLTFAASGLLSGTGALAGSSSLTFALSGTLTGSGPSVTQISGSSSLIFSAVGILSNRSAFNRISAPAPITISFPVPPAALNITPTAAPPLEPIVNSSPPSLAAFVETTSPPELVLTEE